MYGYPHQICIKFYARSGPNLTLMSFDTKPTEKDGPILIERQQCRIQIKQPNLNPKNRSLRISWPWIYHPPGKVIVFWPHLHQMKLLLVRQILQQDDNRTLLEILPVQRTQVLQQDDNRTRLEILPILRTQVRATSDSGQIPAANLQKVTWSWWL